MELEELFLKKEELPILNETCFQVPIHPRLLTEDLRGYENLAKKIFPQVADEWQKELNKNFPLGWKNLIQTAENGLVTGFQISRDYGGSLYFDEYDSDCNALILKEHMNFSDEKIKEFTANEICGFPNAFVYAQTNINDYPGALFLRNWAIKYMNEVFKEVFK